MTLPKVILKALGCINVYGVLITVLGVAVGVTEKKDTPAAFHII